MQQLEFVPGIDMYSCCSIAECLQGGNNATAAQLKVPCPAISVGMQSVDDSRNAYTIAHAFGDMYAILNAHHER